MQIVCCICTEDVTETADHHQNQHPCTTPCGHVFHEHCLSKWLERNSTCPRCRAFCHNIGGAIIRLYLIDDADDGGRRSKTSRPNAAEDEDSIVLLLTEKLSELEVQEKKQSVELVELKREQQSLQDRLHNAEQQRNSAEQLKSWAIEKQALEGRLRDAENGRIKLSQRLENSEKACNDLRITLADREEMGRREMQSLNHRLNIAYGWLLDAERTLDYREGNWRREMRCLKCERDYYYAYNYYYNHYRYYR